LKQACYPLDFDHHRPRLHRSLRDCEIGRAGDDQKPCGGIGPKGIRIVAIAPGPFPTAGATGQLRPQGRDEDWASRNPLGRTGEHVELADLASFLVSDRAGYINGEMVVIDGGAHLRSSGAEDLLRWTDAQWAAQRAARSKD
jgi:NAD(P)-dependent dehydrogenase (short-subunit alcohol dehydrogenase family)